VVNIHPSTSQCHACSGHIYIGTAWLGGEQVSRGGGTELQRLHTGGGCRGHARSACNCTLLPSHLQTCCGVHAIMGYLVRFPKSYIYTKGNHVSLASERKSPLPQFERCPEEQNIKVLHCRMKKSLDKITHPCNFSVLYCEWIELARLGTGDPQRVRLGKLDKSKRCDTMIH
jgi:hypothetical protein